MRYANWLFAVLGVAVLVALFFWFRPDAAKDTDQAPGNASQPREVTFAVERGERVAGPAVVTVARGDRVTLTVTSDRADELHLHGYDLTAAMTAGEPAALSFRATHAGRFALELHDAHLHLATLEVRPR